jgi:uncharacterized membrane protein (GlpM family)
VASLLVLKVTLAPALVGCASLAGRRFGPRVAGWLIGFPVVAGPILWLYAREQGAPFAARAAAGTLLGLLSLCVFLVTYVRCARRLDWPASTLAGWLAFALATVGLLRTPRLAALSWPVALLLAFAALTVTLATLPRPAAPPPARRPRHDLPLRLGATAALVLALTGLARVLGPSLSGLLTPFPIATTVLVAFAQREGGPDNVAAVLAGFIPSLYSFACFCAAVAFFLGRLPIGPAFAAAVLVALVTQAAVLRIVERRSEP